MPGGGRDGPPETTDGWHGTAGTVRCDKAQRAIECSPQNGNPHADHPEPHRCKQYGRLDDEPSIGSAQRAVSMKELHHMRIRGYAASILLAMAGIFGVCHFDDRPIDPALVARMSATLARDGRDGEVLIIEGSTALGSRVLHEASLSASAPRAQPARFSSGTRLVFDGRLDNRDELITALRDRFDVAPAASDAELAAACYEINGVQFVGHLLGDFALAVFDGRRRHVVLARDAMGIRPLYYRRTHTSLMFGSAIKTLLANPDWQAHPNNQLLAELLLRRSHRRLADDGTLFAGVCQVPPAHVVVFTADAAHSERYWDFDCHRSAVGQSFGDHARAFRVLFERAVSRRLRSTHPVAIAVSGGLDSSSIFCAAASAAVGPLVGLTYTSDDGGPSDERAFVREVEHASGRTIRHSVRVQVRGLALAVLVLSACGRSSPAPVEAAPRGFTC